VDTIFTPIAASVQDGVARTLTFRILLIRVIKQQILLNRVSNFFIPMNVTDLHIGVIFARKDRLVQIVRIYKGPKIIVRDLVNNN
jgi:hypothetical protein